ncbi:RTX toxin related protein [beta proteobacterium CB]|nr:RTX toxin related protein [beta proteobacterium CB]
MADQPSNGLTPQQVNDAQHLDNMTSLQQPSAAEQSPITQNGEVKGDVLISSPPTPSPDNPSLFNEPKNPNNKVVEVESQKITEFLDEGEVSDTPSDQGSKYTEDLKGLSGDAINLTITADANDQGIPDEKQPELDPGVNKAGGNTGNQGLAGGGGIPRAGQAPAGNPAAASPANPSSPTSQPNSPTSSQSVEPGPRTEPAPPPPPPAPPTQNLITPQAQFIPEQAKVNAPSILAPDAQTIPEDSTAVGNVLNNDSDVDSALAVTSFSVNGVTYTPGQIAVLPGIGSVTIASNGTYLFTPQPNWNGVVPRIDYTTNTEKQSTLSISVTSVEEVSVVSVSSDSVTENSNLVHTVTLSGAADTAKTYDFALTDVTATGGTDYSNTILFSNLVTYDPVTGKVTVPAGVTSFTVTVDSTADLLDESNETYTVTVGGASGTGAIVDDDMISVVSVSSDSVTENSNLVHTVTLSGAADTAKTYDFALTDVTATGGTDYSNTILFSNLVTYDPVTGKVTVPAGVTSFTVTVDSTADLLDESNETYTVTVGGASGTGAIVDDYVALIPDISIWKSGKVYDNITLTTEDANNQVDSPGDFIQYTVVVKNTGDNTLTSIKLTDEKLPAGGYTLQVGTYNETTGVFTASGPTVTATASNGELSLSNDLFVSQALRLVYVYDVTADDIYSNKISNTIQVDTAQTDPEYKDVLGVANDGVASYEVLVEGISDVAIRKFADVHTAKLADTINYKLIVINEGTTNLTNVQVADKMFAAAADVDSVTAGKQIAGYIYTDGIKASTATNFTVDGAGNLVIGTLSTNQYVEINYSHTITTSDYSIVTTGLVESVFDYTGISKGPYNPDGNSATADPITMSYGTFSAYVNKTTADPYATGGTAANIFINTDNTGVAIGVNAGVMSGDRNYNSDHLKAVFNTSSLNGGKSLVEKASIVFTNAKDVEVAFKAGYGTAGNSFTGSITVSNDGTVSLREVVGGVFTSVLSPAKSGSTTTFTNGQLSFSVSEANGPGGAQNKLYTLEFKPGTEFVKDFDFWVVGDPTDNSSDQIKVVDVLFDTIDFSVPNVTNTAIVTSTEDNAIDQSDEIATVNVALLANLSTSAAQYLGALTTATNIVADAEAVLSTSGSVQWQYTKSNTTLGIQLPKITIADADNNPTTVTNFKYTLEINGSVINSDSVTSNEVTFNLSGLTGTKTGVFHLYTFDNAGGRTEFISSGITIDTSKNTNGNLASFSNVAPIAFDLNGDGVLYLAAEVGIGYDFDGDGIAESTAWIAGSDGLLANQRVDGSLNVVFSRETGETDLQGLAKVYDTNRDNVFDASDAGFNDFGVWQDANSDGIVQEGEFRSLTDRGIISLSLTSDGVINTAADGDVTIYGQTTYTMTDGSTGIAEDVAFAISSVATDGDGIQDIYQIASVTDVPIIVEQFSADDRDRIDLSSILNPTSSVQSTISIDADGSTSTHSNITVNIGGVDYEVATLYGKDIGVEDALGTHPGGASLTDSLNGASWTDVVDISSDHGGPASIFAEGGSLTNSYSNEAGDWTVHIKSGTATVDAANKQITFSSENAENLAIITTADGTSHEIANVDKILWH